MKQLFVSLKRVRLPHRRQPWTQLTIENTVALEKKRKGRQHTTVGDRVVSLPYGCEKKIKIAFQISRISDFDHDLLLTMFLADFRIVRLAT